MPDLIEKNQKFEKQLIIVPGYFKSGSTLMYRYVWPKLGYTMLPKRHAQSDVGLFKRRLAGLILKIKQSKSSLNVGSGRRIDFELTQTAKQTDEIVSLIQMIFKLSQSNKVVAELGFLRPGLNDEILKRLHKPFQLLRSEGIDIKFFFYVREQSELILSRAKHDFRSFPPYLANPPSLTIDSTNLKAIFSEYNVCRCIYPFCISSTVDNSKNDCVGDCGLLGKKVYEWKFYDFTFQVKRFKQLTGITDVYVQPLNYLIMQPQDALKRLASWLDTKMQVDIKVFPKINSSPDSQDNIKMSKQARELIFKKYEGSNKELCQIFNLPSESF